VDSERVVDHLIDAVVIGYRCQWQRVVEHADVVPSFDAGIRRRRQDVPRSTVLRQVLGPAAGERDNGMISQHFGFKIINKYIRENNIAAQPMRAVTGNESFF